MVDRLNADEEDTKVERLLPRSGTRSSARSAEASPAVFSTIDADVLAAIGGDDANTLDPARAVFTNRDLDLAQTKLVGFDMDYTLAIYNKEPMEQLQYDLTVTRLIERFHYPDEIRALKYDPTFIVRGLLLDKRNGHLIKMDTHGRLARVYHGMRRLPEDEIAAQYRSTKLRLSSNMFASVDTLFSMPEACLYANLVAFFEARFAENKSTAPITRPPIPRDAEKVLLGNIDTWQLYDDVRTAIDDIHRDGTLKTIIMADLPKYFVVDDGLATTLHKLRSSGKKLFVLTNSHWPYTDAVMRFLLDGRLKEYASWRQYFDIVIVAGRKPKFFSDREPFLEVDLSPGEDRTVGAMTSERFERGKVYQGGNIETFERAVGAQGEEILYIGDHIFGDILRSKKDSRWRTCVIVEELEDEIRGSVENATTISRMTAVDEARNTLDAAIGGERARLLALEAAAADAQAGARVELQRRLEEAARRLKKEIDIAKRHVRALDKEIHELQDVLDKRFNPWWGRLMKSNNELSRFGAQVELYADVYASRVSNFAQYSPVHFFRAPREMMHHDIVLAELAG